MLHDVFAELSSLVSSVMLLIVFAHFRKNIRGFIMGLAAFPLMFFAEIKRCLLCGRKSGKVGNKNA
jgi:hypothetical protein